MGANICSQRGIKMNHTTDTYSEISDKDVLDLIWKYFEHHGNQRLTHINFFTVLSSALIISQFTIINSQKVVCYIPMILGVIQCIISFVFYKIDDRTKFLVKHAEETITEIERHYNFYNDKEYSKRLRLFTNEVTATREARQYSKCFLFKQISHRLSYRILLASFSVIGLLAGLLGFIRC